MPTTSKPNEFETPMVSDRITYAQIVAQRQQEAHEREEQAKAWAAEVTEELMNQRCKFLEEFEGKK